MEEQPGLLSPAGASSIVGLLLVVAVGVSLYRGLTLFNHFRAATGMSSCFRAQGISEWNSEGANRCAYVLTNLPVAIFASVIISAEPYNVHDCILANSSGMKKVTTMRTP